MLLFQNLAFIIHKKSRPKVVNLKYKLRYRMKGLNYLMDHNLYPMFNIILNISLKT